MAFDEVIATHRMKIKNRPEIFGRQQVVDEEDNFIREEKYLLLNATTLSLDEGTDLCRECGGVCYPAHIDRTSNGAVAILGTFPDWEGYTAYEVSNSGSRTEEEEKFPILKDLPCVKSSDAHYLWDISEADNYFELSDEPYSSQLVRDKLIDLLEGK